MPHQPNILLITTDQQRYDSCGPQAPAFMRTPHFDHLAREGVTFSAAYSDCPVCVPARVAIMTGKSVLSHRHSSNGETLPTLGGAKTLPIYLRELGYQTAAIGKMHFGPQRARHGFEEMILPEDYYRHMQRSGSPLQPMRHGLGQNELYAGMATVPESMTLTSWITDQCLEYIRERRDPTMPFFLWCSFSKPHPPLDPPEPYYSMYRNCDIPAPVFGDWCEGERCPEAFRRFREEWSIDLITPEVIREARAAYYGLITQIDYNMGRIFGALQDVNLFSETMIIYTSDHGEYLGDHHAGSKVFFHEPSAHIPFVLRMPKSWERRGHGATVTTPVTLADILPTAMAAAGGTPPPGIDGLNLLALARGETPTARYIEGLAGDPDAPTFLAITDGRWKYIWYSEGGTEQLFDLQTDPRELCDLACRPAFDEKRRQLHDEMLRRGQARGAAYVDGDQLRAVPRQGDSTRDRRNHAWPGYHTDNFQVDVRH